MTTKDREALVELLMKHIASDKERERATELRTHGGTARTLRAERGKTIYVYQLADELEEFFKTKYL